MDHSLTPLPRPAVVAFVTLGIGAFVLSMLVPALEPDQQSLLGIPLAVVALVWAVPLMLALMRGETWAFIVALALLMFLTDSNFRARAWNDKSVDAQVLVKGLVWMGCGLVGLVRTSATPWIFGRPPVVFAGLLILLMGVSALWSPTPLYTVQAAVAYSWLLLFGLATAQVLDERQLLKAVALGAGMIVLPSLCIAPFAMGLTPPSPGSTGEPDRLRGLTDHPIPLAEVAALFTFAVTALMVRIGVRGSYPVAPAASGHVRLGAGLHSLPARRLDDDGADAHHHHRLGIAAGIHGWLRRHAAGGPAVAVRPLGPFGGNPVTVGAA